MSFNGPALSFDDEGSILFDGEKFIVNVPADDDLLEYFNPPENIPVVYTRPPAAPYNSPTPEPKPVTGPPAFDTGPSPYLAQEVTHFAQPPSTGEEAERRRQRIDKARQRFKNARRPVTNTQTPLDVSQPKEIPDIDEIKFRDTAWAQEFPVNLVDLEFHLAAQHNPLLKEVQLICQHEAVPLTLRENPDLFLSLCAEHGIDEKNDAEARAYLDHRANGGTRHHNPDDPLNATWEETLTAYEMFKADERNEDAKAAYESELKAYKALVENIYGVEFTHDTSDVDKDTAWDLLGIRMAHVAFQEMAKALSIAVDDYFGLHWDDATAFRRLIGDVELFLSNETSSQSGLAIVEGRKITIFWSTAKDRNYYPIPNLLLHELGHVFNANAGMGNRDRFGSINATTGHPNTLTGMGSPYPTKLLTDDRNKLVIHSSSLELVNPLHDDLGLEEHDKLFDNAMSFSQDQVQLLQHSWEYTKNEFTADAFLNWVYHRNTMGVFGFTDTPEGKRWRTFMNDNMETLIQNAIGYSAWRQGIVSSLAEEGLISPIAGTGTVGNFDPDDKSFRVRPTPSLDEDPLTTIRRGETVLVLGESEPDRDGKRWIAVWVNGVHWMREDTIDVAWSDQRPKKPMTEEESEQWFPTLMMLLAGR